MKLDQLLIVLLIIISLGSRAQITDKHEEHDQHMHKNNEVGIANSLVYFINGKEVAYGLHLHYIHYISHTKFGYGLGYERIFDEHGHNVFGVIGTYSPVNSLLLSISPGITFEDGNSSEPGFALHFETTYEFEIGNFHIGPLVGIAYDPEDYHLGVGLHFGYGF